MPSEQHKAFNFQELTIGSDWQVKTREIPGLTRLSVSTLGACRNINGDVFLCGNSGYIRKISSDDNVAWDVNYKSDKRYENAFNVAFSESDKMLVVLGVSFESYTQLTSKDSSLWLAKLDSDGNFKAKSEFEGIAFFTIPSFCLSKSENPIVIYDTNEGVSTYNICVTKFSKDLKTKAWTTHIFDGNDIMVSRMSLTPLDNYYTLAAFNTMATYKELTENGRFNMRFYILDNNGNVVNQAVFKDIRSSNYLVTVLKNRIFLVTKGHKYQEGKDTEFARLICFKIYSGKG